MEKIVGKLAGFGVPGLVLIVAINMTGLAGAAGIVKALAVLGGPFGMLGGLAALGTLALVSDEIGEYGSKRVFDGVLERLRNQGWSDEEIEEQVSGYPIPQFVKTAILQWIRGE